MKDTALKILPQGVLTLVYLSQLTLSYHSTWPVPVYIPVTHRVIFDELVRSTCDILGLPQSWVSTHSLRYGRAVLAAAGFPQYISIAYGSWTKKSKARLIYTCLTQSTNALVPNICPEPIYMPKKSLLTSWCPVLIRITVQRTLLSLRIVLDGPPSRREKEANPRWRRRENNSALRTEGCTFLYIYYISIRTSTNIPE